MLTSYGVMNLMNVVKLQTWKRALSATTICYIWART